jgi:hypothetical protein
MPEELVKEGGGELAGWIFVQLLFDHALQDTRY